MRPLLIGFIFFFGGVVASRYVMTSALRKLDDTAKLSLVNNFSASSSNYLNLIVLLMLIFMFFAGVSYYPEHRILITGGYFLAFIAFLVYRFFANRGKLIGISMPGSYLQSFYLSQAVFGVGLIGFIVFVYFELIER